MKVYEKPFAIFEKNLWYFSDASSVEELDGDGNWGLWESLAWTRHVICPGSELGDAVGRLSPQTVRPGGVTNAIFPGVRKLSRSQMGKKNPWFAWRLLLEASWKTMPIAQTLKRHCLTGNLCVNSSTWLYYLGKLPYYSPRSSSRLRRKVKQEKQC